MARGHLWEVLDRGAEGVEEVDFVAASWDEGLRMRRRRRALTATGLTAAGVGAVALAVVLGGGTGPDAGPLPPAVTPTSDVLVSDTPSTTPTEDVTASASTTRTGTAAPTGPTTPPAEARFAFDVSSIGGVPLPAASADVIPVLEAAFGPRSGAPVLDADGAFETAPDTACAPLALAPRAGVRDLSYWTLEDGELFVFEREVAGTMMVEGYRVSVRAPDVDLPRGLEVGMSLEDARALLPAAETHDLELASTLLRGWPDVPIEQRLSDGQVHAWLEPGASTVAMVQSGPSSCTDPGDLVYLGDPTYDPMGGRHGIQESVLPAPVDEVVPGLTQVLGEPATSRGANTCPTGSDTIYTWPGGLELQATEVDGVQVVEGWTFTGTDDRVILVGDFWVGQPLEDAQASGSLELMPERPDGSRLARGSGALDLALTFEPDDEGRLRLTTLEHRPTMCGVGHLRWGDAP
ncbi:hypothetical protein [Ornithinimicrobium tianjinense]|nr:hypothetical protein [Ornithinimicrobium tianjinense]